MELTLPCQRSSPVQSCSSPTAHECFQPACPAHCPDEVGGQPAGWDDAAITWSDGSDVEPFCAFTVVELTPLLLPDSCRLGWGCRRPATGTGWFPAGRGRPQGPSCTPWRAQCASSLWAAAPRSTESSQQGARTWNLRGVRPTGSVPWSEKRAWKCCDLKAVKLSRLLEGIQKANFFTPLHALAKLESGVTAVFHVHY